MYVVYECGTARAVVRCLRWQEKKRAVSGVTILGRPAASALPPFPDYTIVMYIILFFLLNSDASSPICSNDMDLDMIINSTHRPIN